jgi:uncharacterized protein YjbI with pentapeptide repeats
MSVTILLIFGSALLTVVLLIGLWLSWPRTPPREKYEQLGRPLLVSAIIGLAFLPLQFAVQRELKLSDQLAADQQKHDDARRTLLLQLTLRTNLKGIDLSHHNLRRLYLRSKDLREALLEHTDLSEAILAHADLRSVDAYRAKFDHADLTGADFKHAVLLEASFKHAGLRGADFSRRTDPINLDPLIQADFSHAILDNANLSFATAEEGSRFVGASFYDTNLNSSNFIDVDLRNAVLFNIRASYAFFCHADLRGATIAGAAKASMHGAQFTAANLRYARFETGTDFTGANFRGADLRGSRIVTDVTPPASGGGYVSGLPPRGRAKDLFRGAYYDRYTKGADFLKRYGAHRSKSSLDCSRSTKTMAAGTTVSRLNDP